MAYCCAKKPPKLPPMTMQRLSPAKCLRKDSISSTICLKEYGLVGELCPWPRKSKDKTRYLFARGEYALKSEPRDPASPFTFS
jgi:hypothetical protein